MRITRQLTTSAVLVAGLAIAGPGVAQTASVIGPYAGQQARAIKSLSPSDITGLLEGQGAGHAKAAELNGYPGPAHTLELKQQLGLDAQQVAASEALMASHKARARALGAAVVEAERTLDDLFAGKQASVESVDTATREVGVLQAQLRAEHLATHLAQTALLDVHQIQRYSVLRGYADAKPAESAPGRPAPATSHRQHH